MKVLASSLKVGDLVIVQGTRRRRIDYVKNERGLTSLSIHGLGTWHYKAGEKVELAEDQEIRKLESELKKL